MRAGTPPASIINYKEKEIVRHSQITIANIGRGSLKMTTVAPLKNKKTRIELPADLLCQVHTRLCGPFAPFSMPLYELMCLAKPALPRQELARIMQRVGELVMNRGGVLTNVTSYGEQHLAYDIRRPFERYAKVT